eukprot:9685077-Ditylum_brightwellii.AAC.1
MDLWEKGDYTALVEDTIKVNKHQQPMGQRNKLAEHICRVYTQILLEGKLWQAVQWVAGRDKGGLLFPSDTDTNTGLTVNTPAPHHPQRAPLTSMKSCQLS